MPLSFFDLPPEIRLPILELWIYANGNQFGKVKLEGISHQFDDELHSVLLQLDEPHWAAKLDTQQARLWTARILEHQLREGLRHPYSVHEHLRLIAAACVDLMGGKSEDFWKPISILGFRSLELDWKWTNQKLDERVSVSLESMIPELDAISVAAFLGREDVLSNTEKNISRYISQTSFLVSPVRAAVWGGQASSIEILCGQGFQADNADFGSAIVQDDILSLKALLATNQCVEGVRCSDVEIDYAAECNRVACLQLLLAAGANPDGIQNDNFYIQQTPLIHAILNQNLETMEILLQAGADVNTASVSYEKMTPLIAAVTTQNQDVIDRVLQEGPDVNWSGGKHGTALQATVLCASRGTFGRMEPHKMLSIVQGIHKARVDSAIDKLPGFAESDNVSLVRLLLSMGAEVNTRAGFCDTALQAAAFLGRTESMKVLLAAGANIHFYGGAFGTVLQAAATCCGPDHLGIMRRLIQIGVDVNSEAELGSALHAAAAFGSREAVQLLLDAGANVNCRNGPYWTVLQAAACNPYDSYNIVKMILEAGAMVNDKETIGGQSYAPIYAAIDNPKASLRTIKLLVNASEEEVVSPRWITWRGTPLAFAISRKRKDVVYFILDRFILSPGTTRERMREVQGEDENKERVDEQQEPTDGMFREDNNRRRGGRDHPTAFQAAVQTQDIEMARTLLRCGANPKIWLQYGASLIHLLLEEEENPSPEMMRFLLDEAGIDANRAGISCRYPPLAKACMKGLDEIVTILIESGGANIHGKNLRYPSLPVYYPSSPIYVAVTNKHPSIVKILIKAGVDVNPQRGDVESSSSSSSYESPLYIATESGQAGMAKILLEAGADVHFEDNSRHETALHVASGRGDLDLMKLLLRYGANPHLKSALKGRTALDVARDRETRVLLQTAAVQGVLLS